MSTVTFKTKTSTYSMCMHIGHIWYHW